MFLIKSTAVPIVISGVLNIITVVGLFWIDESPIWLLKAGKVEETREVIRRIYKVNGYLKNDANSPLLENRKIDDAFKTLAVAIGPLETKKEELPGIRFFL